MTVTHKGWGISILVLGVLGAAWWGYVKAYGARQQATPAGYVWKQEDVTTAHQKLRPETYPVSGPSCIDDEGHNLCQKT